MRPASVVVALAVPFASLSAQTLDAICAGERIAFEPPPFEAFDADMDEQLELMEVAECFSLSAVFEELDLNADQVLTRPEYVPYGDLWRLRARSFGVD